MKKYAFFDGDNVGSTIEILLIEDRISDAQELSNNITKSLKKIKRRIENKSEIIIMGGDDLLIRVEEKRIEEVVKDVREIFSEETGLTISCGIADTVKSSIYQLSMAKLYGKNQVKFEKNV